MKKPVLWIQFDGELTIEKFDGVASLSAALEDRFSSPLHVGRFRLLESNVRTGSWKLFVARLTEILGHNNWDVYCPSKGSVRSWPDRPPPTGQFTPGRVSSQ